MNFGSVTWIVVTTSALLSGCSFEELFRDILGNETENQCGGIRQQEEILVSKREFERLTSETIERLREYVAADPQQKSVLFAGLKEALTKRGAFLQQRLNAESGILLQHNLISTDVSALPEELASCVEKEVQAEGELRVLSFEGSALSDAPHFMFKATDGSQWRIHAAGDTTPFDSGAIFRFHGLTVPCAADNQVVVDGKDIQPTRGMLAEVHASTLGEQKIAVLLVSFQDKVSPYTAKTVSDVIFGQSNRFIQENSSSRTWLSGEVFGPYVLPISAAGCSFDAISSHARSAASGAGVDLSRYTRSVYVFPKNGCSWSGLGTVGGSSSEAWINGSLNLHTVTHELGHNFGLWHANALNCGTTDSYRSGCTDIEYGDTTDVMGNQVAGHFSAYHKEKLGWLSAGSFSSITQVKESGTFTLEPYETTTSGPKALKIYQGISASGIKSYLYVEYRQPIGFDQVFSTLFYENNLTRGVVVHSGADHRDKSSLLLNMNPSRRSWFQAALGIGATFFEPASGIRITLNEADETHVTLQVTAGAAEPASAECRR